MDEELQRRFQQARQSRVLDLSRTRFTALPPEIRQLQNLQSLYLSRTGLTAWPPEIEQLQNLRHLYFSETNITALPPEIGQLQNLRLLGLSRTNITTLPSEIGQLQSLQSLDLSRTSITMLPPEVGLLQSLQSLDLSRTNITSLPPEIGQLQSLRSLDLSRTNITSLPLEIGQLQSLQSLYLSGTNITALPPEIGQLQRLQSLDLSGTNITALPPEIGQLHKLQILALPENPLRYPPPHITSQRTEGILAFLRQEMGQRSEARLILLGNGGVGKTCLSRALRGEVFSEQNTTQGVDIQTWELPHPVAPADPTQNITLKLWDFEGQEISHQSHQFFLDPSALYLLVFNGRRYMESQDTEGIRYWLESIRSRAPGCKVLLVATECENRSPLIPLDDLRAEYSDLLIENGYFEVGSKSGKNIPMLITRIQQLIAALPTVPQRWPKLYTRAEETIREKAEHYAHIDREGLCTLLKKEGVGQDEEESLARSLGALGVITHFPDRPNLRDFVVLRPQWLTRAISVAMEHPPLTANHGETSLAELERLWRKDYPGLFNNFYHCMREFELCYPLEAGSVLVPLRFRAQRPIIPWSLPAQGGERRLQYRYIGLPPAGLMSRFIVKVHHLIARTEEMPNGVYWNQGVFLRTGEGKMLAEALCELDRNTQTIRFTVRAAWPQNILSLIHDNLQAVFSFFQGFKVQRFYGCIHEDGRPCQGFHDEETVAWTLEAGIALPCASGRHHVEPLHLLTNLPTTVPAIEVLVRKAVREVKPDWANELQRSQSAALIFLQRLEGQIGALRDQSAEEKAVWAQQVAQATRQWLNLVEEREWNRCPGLFVVMPLKSQPINPRQFFRQRFQLRFWCEHEIPHPSDYQREFQRRQKWWETTAPLISTGLYIGVLASSLGLVDVPLVSSSEVVVPNEKELEMMKELLERIELSSGAESDLGRGRLEGLDAWRDEERRYRSIEGPLPEARAQLNAMMQELDPGTYNAQPPRWGKLERHLMPDNSFRWLCPDHAPR